MSKKIQYILLFLFVSLSLWASESRQVRKYKKEQLWADKAQSFVRLAVQDTSLFTPLYRTQLDTLYKNRGIQIYYTEEFAYNTLRQGDVDAIYHILREDFGVSKREKMQVYVDKLPLEQYVPNYHLKSKDKERMISPYEGEVNVCSLSKPYQIKRGMAQRHIALWNSHGYYYNHERGEWLFQRAPLFTTVEDLFTSTYVLTYLTPMLENAGANVYLPRERDVQTNELIVDNEDKNFSIYGFNFDENVVGFKNNVELTSSSVNPFKLGNSIVWQKDGVAIWDILVPESGKYAVYVSYTTLENSSKEVLYSVNHSGGITYFSVNQQIGGGTWIYLGTFDFKKEEKNDITLQNAGKGVVSADAVRLGGGMGSVVRGGSVSGVPRWQEAARYYLQYSGATDSLTYNLHGDTLDYSDDFRSRARWVNYLRGGESIEKHLLGEVQSEGLSIPIDLAMGFHTDAGHFPSMDTTVGTLAIYSTYDVAKNRSFYYNKTRLLNRDLADLMQEQIVNDVRALYCNDWTKRELWDKMYSEATFAQVPSFLLELLSHGNALDMRYGLDPNFRFDVSRAIYKAMLRFLSSYYNEDYVVQPLPVSHFRMEKSEGKTLLKWDATEDELEPSAEAHSFVVYKRLGDRGWDNGALVKDNYLEIENDSTLCSYKVTAVNDGGESFPSTILTTRYCSDSLPTVLVVDGFSRVASPFFMENGDSVGIAPWEDEGVAYGLDIATIGWQYEYDQKKPWVSDQIPGHGGSSFELASTLFMGNNFDHSYVHAKAFSELGYNVVSAQMSAVEQGLVKLSDYDLVNVIYGEQRSDIYPDGKVKHAIYSLDMMKIFRAYLKDDSAKLIISGAHLATDAYADTSSHVLNERTAFIKNVLGFDLGGRMQEEGIFPLSDTLVFRYNIDYNQTQYRVEQTDVLQPYSDAEIVCDYLKNQAAVVFYNPSYRVISSAVPLESIKSDLDRKNILEMWLNLIEN